ncbi:hypothetical protein [Kitasatospora sp. NPDC057015]|uniref:hypothetical protein n=1 Tax=Kitasatospora sp. NPDC057015 TaxID=3346001 RepID=UPI00364151C7
MRVAEVPGWEREFPLRYLLVRESRDEEDPEAVDLLARCADVEGLYLEPVPPPREILTLRGCPRDSRLAELATRPTQSERLLGNLLLEVFDPAGRVPPDSCILVDVSVITHRPTLGDPERIDLVIGTGVGDGLYDGRKFLPPVTPHFEFSSLKGRTELIGSCLDIGGLYVELPRRPDPIQLIGCEPTEVLLDRLLDPNPRRGDRGQLVALDRTGRIMSDHDVVLDVTSARPSVLGGSLLDVTLADGGLDRPAPEARAVRELWYDGEPTVPNQWAPLATRGRWEWLRLTNLGPYRPDPGHSGGEYHLDGRFVTDAPGLFLAIGEAVLGPGRELGRSLFWLRDRLGGGPSVVPPFTLVWHDAQVARQALADDIATADPGLSLFEEVLDILRERGVTVVLA